MPLKEVVMTAKSCPDTLCRGHYEVFNKKYNYCPYWGRRLGEVIVTITEAESNHAETD